MSGLGIIAGTGELPLQVASEAAGRGMRVVVLAFPGFTDRAIENEADDVSWQKLGKLQEPIAFFKSQGIERVVMAGKIEKSNLLRPWNLRFDRRALRMIRSLKDWRDDTVLEAIADEFAKDGIVIDEMTPWVGALLAEQGVVTKRSPTERQLRDIEFGRTMAQGIGDLDIGQTVVVKNGAVIVVEAIEGTDRAIRRTADLGIRHAVVVKMAKPDQDMRFDVPGVGPSTIESMIAAKARVLAVEAGKTLVANREEMISKANKAKITVVGIPPDGPAILR